MTNKPRGTLYVGVTNNLPHRIWQHREGVVDGFTKTHNLKSLAFFEQHATVPLAIQREKNIKRWSRQWKLELVESTNPKWDDLFKQLG